MMWMFAGDQPTIVFVPGAYSLIPAIAMAVSHELGHTLVSGFIMVVRLTRSLESLATKHVGEDFEPMHDDQWSN
jgi:hypothetical protein